jgi:hypothetical protein
MRFSAVSPVFVKLGRQVSYFLKLLQSFAKFCRKPLTCQINLQITGLTAENAYLPDNLYK